MRRMRMMLVACLPAILAGCISGSDAGAQTWRTLTTERQVQDREPLSVRIHYGAGRLEVVAAEAPTLYRMELRYDEDVVQPLAEYSREDRRVRLGVRSVEGRSFSRREGSTAKLQLTREVPLDLDLEFGAGKADLRLGGLQLRRLSVSTGASETTIDFDVPSPIAAERVSIEAGAADLKVTGLGNTGARTISFQGGVGSTVLDFTGGIRADTHLSVQMGVGSVTLRLPRSAGVRLNRSSFLTSFSGAGLERQGNSYVSSNWGSADRKLTIDINAALGSIDVQWVD
jgi:hypothetical protein